MVRGERFELSITWISAKGINHCATPVYYWHRPQYIGGNAANRTQDHRATIYCFTTKLHSPYFLYFSYLSFTNILYHNFFVFSNKELWLYWHSLWTELSLPCRQSYRVCCTTIGLSPYPPFATLRRACVAADRF